ncbi:MAG: amino acid ABC transporter permease [Caldilineaceae bacterium]|nr:amino acid ABC transporter permease [Caldilineaceae bacterium]
MSTDISQTTWVNSAHPAPARKPPASEVGVVGWLRANLFSGIFNSILTIGTVVVLYFIVTRLGSWALNAYWEPIWANRKLFAAGPYPTDQLWQPAAVLVLISLLFGLSAGRWGSIMRSLSVGLGMLLALLAIIPIGLQGQIVMGVSLALLVGGFLVGVRVRIASIWLAIAWIISLPVTFVLLNGGVTLTGIGISWSFAPLVDTNLWGGFLLTLLLAVVGIALSFPLGVALALGRRSNLPVIKYFSIGYIELIRGVPLITLLFMGMTMVPLFLPSNWGNPSQLVRAMVAITMFSAAYLAENVRGGLQAIPQGQFEAADALGLSGVDRLRFIILPQALTKVIPAIVGQFIGLFKDTSLASLVGLLELVAVAKSVIQQPEWLGVPGGVAKETYVFIAIVFFVFSYGMSFASRRLEIQLGVGKR